MSNGSGESGRTLEQMATVSTVASLLALLPTEAEHSELVRCVNKIIPPAAAKDVLGNVLQYGAKYGKPAMDSFIHDGLHDVFVTLCLDESSGRLAAQRVAIVLMAEARLGRDKSMRNSSRMPRVLIGDIDRRDSLWVLNMALFLTWVSQGMRDREQFVFSGIAAALAWSRLAEMTDNILLSQCKNVLSNVQDMGMRLGFDTGDKAKWIRFAGDSNTIRTQGSVNRLLEIIEMAS